MTGTGVAPFLSPRSFSKPEPMADITTQSTDQAAAQGESWTELAKTVIYAGLIAVVIRTFLFQPFNIPSASMEAHLAGRRLSVRGEIRLRL